MKSSPTYTASEIKEMAGKVKDYHAMKILSELISEEIDRYNLEDLQTITEVAMQLFVRSLLMKFLKP